MVDGNSPGPQQVSSGGHRVRLGHRAAHQQAKRWRASTDDPEEVEHWVDAGALRAAGLQRGGRPGPSYGVGRLDRDHLTSERADERLPVAFGPDLDPAQRSPRTDLGERLSTPPRIVRHRLHHALRHVGRQLTGEIDHLALGRAELVRSSGIVHRLNSK